MNSDSTNATVPLIGASRGLGYAIAEEYIDRGSQVVATVRSPARTALHELHDAAGRRLEIENVDINAPE
jgi:NAD(P)-dependent dehydrogenase (short-subunit alcohol dehydrogenase family)